MEPVTHPLAGVILSYARSENCLRLVEDLIANDCRSVFIYLDGPKTENVRISQEALINALRNREYPSQVSVSIRRATSNQGIAISMIRALDWFFANFEEGFVLEDDLMFSKSFLPFVKFNLQKFRADKEVFMISGNRYSSEQVPGNIAWCNYPQTWGWATWKRSWVVFRQNYKFQIKLSDFSLFSVRNNFWAMGSDYVNRRRVDTWDIPLAQFMLKNRYLTLLPPLNLVTNLGNDQYATHTTRDSFPLGFPIHVLQPNQIDENYSLVNRQATAKDENTFLEKYVFRIKIRHLFLYLKFIFRITSSDSLQDRLLDEDTYQEYRFG